MNESKFSFKPDIPASLRPEIEKLFLPFEWLIPTWCDHVNIHWYSDGNDSRAMDTAAYYDYRYAEIKIYPSFHDQNKRIQQRGILHELLHIVSAPLADYAAHTIELLLEPDAPKFNRHAQDELRIRYEAMTQDLTHIVERKLLRKS
jgi:hypothetical protein